MRTSLRLLPAATAQRRDGAESVITIERPSPAVVRAAAVHSIAVAFVSFLSFWLVSVALAHVDSLSSADDLLGGLWAAVATVFVYRTRTGYRESVAAATQRISATLVSFALCFLYLMVAPFHALGLAVLIGLGSLVLALAGRPGDVTVASITTAVVMVAAALSPAPRWEQPVLYLVVTSVGVAVGLVGAWLALRLIEPPGQRLR